jgi:hypothetical protein
METETIKTIGWGIPFAFFCYKALLGGLNKISTNNSEKIKSQEDLELILAEEKERLNLNENIIVSKKYIRTSFTTKYGDDSYSISLSSSQMNRGTLRHELFHIKDKHFDEDSNYLIDKIKYLFYYEPKTIIHCLKNKTKEKN